MNTTGTNTSNCAEAVPPKYEIIDREGKTLGPFRTIAEARAIAAHLLGDQDDDRTGNGWDIQIVGT